MYRNRWDWGAESRFEKRRIILISNHQGRLSPQCSGPKVAAIWELPYPEWFNWGQLFPTPPCPQPLCHPWNDRALWKEMGVKAVPESSVKGDTRKKGEGSSHILNQEGQEQSLRGEEGNGKESSSSERSCSPLHPRTRSLPSHSWPLHQDCASGQPSSSCHLFWCSSLACFPLPWWLSRGHSLYFPTSPRQP